MSKKPKNSRRSGNPAKAALGPQPAVAAEENSEPVETPAARRQPVAVRVAPRIPRRQKFALAVAFFAPASLTLWGIQTAYNSLSQGRSGTAAVGVAALVGFGSLLVFITVTNWWLLRKEPISTRPERSWGKTLRTVGFIIMAFLLVISMLIPLLEASTSLSPEELSGSNSPAPQAPLPLPVPESPEAPE